MEKGGNTLSLLPPDHRQEFCQAGQNNDYSSPLYRIEECMKRIMNQQAQLLSTSEILGQAYNYAFLEIPSYHFIVPKRPAFIPATVTGKESRCLHCGKIIATAYKNHGELYLDNTRLDRQKQLYSKYGRSFPAIEAGDPLIYQQEGYCYECFPAVQKELNETAQSIYAICSQLIQGDTGLIPTALAGLAIPPAGTTKEDLEASVAADESVQEVLQQYRRQCQNLIAAAADLLAQIATSKLEAYVGKSLNIPESMSDSIYNEYTVAMPAEDTSDEYFFVKATIKKANVENFLKLSRIDSVEKFLAEPEVKEALLLAHS